MSLLSDPMISKPCLIDFSNDFPVDLQNEDDCTSLSVNGVSSSSPGYESEDSGTGNSLYDIDCETLTNRPLYQHSLHDDSVELPIDTIAIAMDCAFNKNNIEQFDSETESNPLFTELTTDTVTMGRFGNLVDEETDADLLNYLVNPKKVCEVDEPSRKHVTVNVLEEYSDVELDVLSLGESKNDAPVSTSVVELEVDENETPSNDLEQSTDEADTFSVDKCKRRSARLLKEQAVLNHKRHPSSRLIKATRSTAEVARKQIRQIEEQCEEMPHSSRSKNDKYKRKEVEPETGKRSAAEQARLNRLKKKEYINGLEAEVSTLERENKGLKIQNLRLNRSKKALEEEVAYLKNVLANQSVLSSLLKNINGVDGVTLSTSFGSNSKRSLDTDHDYESQRSKRSRVETAPSSGGVCLHVDKNSVSLEFCSACARKASE